MPEEEDPLHYMSNWRPIAGLVLTFLLLTSRPSQSQDRATVIRRKRTGENMNTILRNTLSVLAGVLIGSLVNMGLIMISGKIIAPPSGADVTTLEGLRSSIHLFEPKHFLFPFLAHALGTLAGALVAAFLASSHKIKLALVIGVVFLVGGIANVLMLPSPLWFNIADIVASYIPMAYLGGRVATKKL